METVLPQPKEKRLKVLYSCPAGFNFEIEYVDPNGQGFAFNKYRSAINVHHRRFHKHLEELKQKHPRCSGLTSKTI